GNGAFVGINVNASRLLTSPDGVFWTKHGSDATTTTNVNSSSGLTAVAYGDGTFVAVGWYYDPTVGGVGNIVTSPDGANWTRQNDASSASLFGITYGQGKFVAVGDGAILASPDGVAWSQSSNVVALRDVTYRNGTFVAVGYRYVADRQ